MQEFNNRKKADKFAEYITGKGLRRLIAQKVREYSDKDRFSVIDGAMGSGQLEFFLADSITQFYGIEIQAEACEVAKENFPSADIHNKSFFTYEHTAPLADMAIMNPPFSLKYNDATDEEKTAIHNTLPRKKSGCLDEVFLLKAMSHVRRFGFFIMFPGVCYRGAEQRMREEVGNTLVEIARAQHAFEDTCIEVDLIIIDKENALPQYRATLYDCKDDEPQLLGGEMLTINAEHWQTFTPEQPKESVDIGDVNRQLQQHLHRSIRAYWENLNLREEFFHEDVERERIKLKQLVEAL